MKIKYFIFGILINLLLINVYAAKLEIGIEGKPVINEKESASINVSLKLDEEEEKIENIIFDLEYGNDIVENANELLTIVDNKNEFGYLSTYKGNTATIVKLPDKSFVDGNVISFNVTNIYPLDGIAQIKIKNAKIKYSDDKTIEIPDEDIKPLNLTLKKEVTTTTKALNTKVDIKGFSLTNKATMKPAYSKDVKEYKIYINKDTIKQVTIMPQYEEGVSGVQLEVECTLGCTPDTSALNKLNLIVGKNEANFSLISEDGKTKETYKFIIYRGPTTDGSNLLADLSLEGYNINEKFDKSNLDYTVTIPYTVENLNVIATPEDENADVSIKGNEKLVVGENVITITVTSTETMEKKIYNITATREEFVPEEENTTVVTPKIEKDEPSESTNNNNTKLLIIIGGISSLIIIISAYFIFFYKGKKRKSAVPEIASIEHSNELINEEKEPTTVDDALLDLMQTKSLTGINDKNDDKPTL